MYFIVMEGETGPTNKFGWPNSGVLLEFDLLVLQKQLRTQITDHVIFFTLMKLNMQI